jgi:hypothetical protein
MEVGIVAEAQSTQRRPEHEASRAARTHASTMINSGPSDRASGGGGEAGPSDPARACPRRPSIAGLGALWSGVVG